MHEKSNMVGSTNSVHDEFIHQMVYRLESYGPRIEKCMNMLSEKQVWQRPNPSSNSIANLIIHLCGNMSQYILSGIGNVPFERRRNEEFSTHTGYSKQELLTMLSRTVKQCTDVLKELAPSQLLQTTDVQGFRYTFLGICVHVVEHYSYHTGQIAFYTKLLVDKDLGFYAGLNLDQD